MGSLFAAGAALLRSTSEEGHTSVDITISHKGYITDEIDAVIGTTRRQVQDSSGAIIEWESTDFTISAEKLVLNGRQVEPEKGMRISRQFPDRTEVFEVQSPGDELPWQWKDSGRTRMRIHTVKVKTK